MYTIAEIDSLDAKLTNHINMLAFQRSFTSDFEIKNHLSDLAAGVEFAQSLPKTVNKK